VAASRAPALVRASRATGERRPLRRPGNGLSQREVADLSLDAHVRDLDAVVSQLGPEPVTLLGVFHSGPAAIAYAASHPDRVSHLILWCTYALGSDYWRAPQAEGLRALRQTDYRLFVRTGAHELLGWEDDAQAARFAEIMEAAVSPEEADRLIASTRSIDVTAALPQIKCPTLVVHRRQMRWLDVALSRSLASSVPGARLLILEGPSPLPAAGDIDVAARSIGEFLEWGPEPPAKRIRQYEILSLLGEGGMGQVYLAVDHKLGRRVAMKALPPRLTDDEQAGRRLLREARAAARLDHPNICAIHEIVEEEGRASSSCRSSRGRRSRRAWRGASRRRRGDRDRPPGGRRARGGAREGDRPPRHQAAERHAPGRGPVKVLDFGVAADRGDSRGADEATATQLTTPGMVVGTWPYMSPEQVRGEPLDERSDLFSLGVVLFEMVWGFHPFKAGSTAEIASNILTRDPFSADGLDASRSPALAPVVQRCLEKDPARRHATANDLIAALEGARSGAAAAPPAVAPRRSRRRALTVAMLLLVVVAIGAAVAMRWAMRPNNSAYDDYVRGKVKMGLVSREGVDAAVKLFESSVAADASFAPAQAELAKAYIYKAFQFGSPEEQKRLFEDADVAIQKALALNPNLAEAYLARGLLVWTRPRGFPHEMAIRAFRRAIELDPNLDEAHLELGVIYMHVGLLDQAWSEIQRALTINPDNTLARTRTGTIALYGGDYGKAIDILKGVPEETSPSYRSRALADALFRSGRFADAETLTDGYLRRYPSDEGGSLTSVKAMLLAHDGRREEAEAAIRRAIEIGQMAGHFHHTAFNIGCAYAILGKPDLAVHWLEVAARDGFPCLPYYENDQSLDAIRADPGFVALLAELKTQHDGLAALK
jgi:pimeloyl-ACP methyl ester carboxylesterase/tetratricopeptide (TPR) repeat protein